MKVLVAEDDPISAKLLEMSLRQFGCQVVTAPDGRAALEAYSREPFDVVIADWMMPVMDGLDLTRKIREFRGREYPWVIVLTTKVFKDNYAKAMEAGIDDFLSKPLDRDLLRVRLLVSARVQRSRRQVSEIAKLMPICMHCKSVKPAEQGWKRIEEFLALQGDVSHGFCPECYWDKSVAPDLHAFIEARGSIADVESVIDVAARAALDDFDRVSAPGIASDARVAFRELALHRMSADLEMLATGGRIGAPMLARYCEAANAIGAGRLLTLLVRMSEVPPSGIAPAAREELTRVLQALFPEPAAAGSGTSRPAAILRAVPGP